MVGKNYGVFRRRPDYLQHIRRIKPITITAPPVIPVLKSSITGNRDVFRRAHDYWLSFRLTRRVKPITITVAVSGILRLSEAKYRDHAVYKRRTDYLRYARRIKPITITAPPRVVLLRSPGAVYLNRAVFRREYDYWLRYTKQIMPITITAPPVVPVLNSPIVWLRRRRRQI